MSPPELARLLDAWYWFGGPGAGATPYTYVLLALFAAFTAGSTAVWWMRKRVFAGDRALVLLAGGLGPWFITFSAAGLGFLLLRVAESPILTARSLWVLCLVGLAALAVYAGWYMRVRYPIDAAAYERERQHERATPRRRPRKRSAARRR